MRGLAVADGAVALLAAWSAYQVSLQAGFSWLPAAAPAGCRSPPTRRSGAG
ncbi:MAG TPA: hypothetical protein VOB72_24820 [Candidatus Dormibacteraeota bacterium]|nr:hypothetical protein [Candidatus Dormibacteraeota bacterium]